MRLHPATRTLLAAVAFAACVSLTSPTLAATPSLSAAGAPAVSTPTQAPAAPAATPRAKPLRTVFGTTAQRRPGEDLGDAIARQESSYGHLRTLRLFFPGLPGSWESIHAETGMRPLVVSFKADPVGVLDGSYDQALSDWFASAPRGVRVWWSYWHEPEDDIASGAFTAEQYRAAWTHVATLAAQAGNARLRASLILMCWTAEPNSHRDWHDYYVPGAVKVLSWDCYNAGWRNGAYRTPESLFAEVLAIAEETHLPYGISELGSVRATGDETGAGRAVWLDTVSQYLRSHQARFVTYFDSNIGVEFRLLDEHSRSAWARAVFTSWPRTRQ